MGRGNSRRLKGEYDQALPDLDKSIALKPDYAESHYDRRARPDHIKPDQPNAADITEISKPTDPAAHYLLLWAHYARVHAGQDNSREMAELADTLAQPIWKFLFMNYPIRPDIATEAQTIAFKPWPGAIYLMFLGKTTPEVVRAAVQAAGDEAARKRRQCDADFYLAVFAMQKKADARALLQAAAADCPTNAREREFAKSELTLLGS
jgi:hypothetical protein